MAGTLGYVEEFDSIYFFVANGISLAEKKHTVFLSLVGAATCNILQNLVSPAKPGDKTYGELVDALS